MKISADATGVKQQLSPLQRNLQQIEAEASKVTDVFKRLGVESAAASAAQEKFAIRVQALIESLAKGLTSPQDFAKSLQQLSAAATEEANELQRASEIIEANLTKEEIAQRKFSASTEELTRLRRNGRLTEEEFQKALQRSAEEYAKATVEANKLNKATEDIGKGGTLKFNELSGALAVLPGPLGAVAGRISGISSAAEGLSRAFSGGLADGLDNIAATVANLINPFTAGVAVVAAFGAGVTSVARGLVELEGRAQKLGNIADKLGVSFEFIQVLDEAARRSGTSIDAVSAAFGRLQRNVTGVDEESKAAQAALQNIGVTAEQLQALNPAEQYKLIGDRLREIENPAQRTAAAISLFGRAGADLLPFFENIPKAADDIERFGRALTDLDRGRIEDFGDGINALAVATQGLGTTLLLPFAGLGEGVSRASADFISAVTAVVDVIGRALTPALDQIGFVIDATGTVLGSLAPLFRTLGDVIAPIADYLLPAVVAQMVALNAQAVAGAISSLAGFFTATATALIGYATSAGTASISTAALAASVRGLLASTGVGALVVGLGLAANALFEWFSTADDAAKNLDASSNAAKAAGDSAAAAAEKQKELVAAEKKAREERERTFQRLREEVNNAIDDSRKFGAEGQAAAQKYDQSIEALKKRLSSGLIDEEQFRRSVRIAGQVFDEELKAIEDKKELEIKVKEDAAKAIEKVGDEIDKAAIKAEDFGAAGQQALGTFSQRAEQLKQQFARGLIDDKQLEKGIAAANREYDKQIEKIKQANQERQRAAEEDKKRSDAILDEMDKTRAVQRDMETVQREINRLRTESGGFVYLTPEQRQQLQDLQQAQVELGEKQRAVAQGFEKGYSEAFDKTQEKFTQLSEKAEEFGAAGQAAAQRLAAGLQAAAEQARRGGSAEQYEQEVARQQRLYENELKNLKAVADERKKTNELVENELLLISVNGDSKRAEAKKNLLAIEEEMLRVQKEQQAAREANDSKALNDATKRLADLDQVAAKERDIASGAAGQREQFGKQQEQALKEQEKQQQQIIQQQQKADEERAKAQQAEYERQVKRITELNTLGSRTVETADVRTQEGAALVLNLAANAQGPALIEARLQSKYLRQINENIQASARAQANRIVAIAGANFANTFN